MNICFWRFTFLAACAFAIFSWNVSVVVVVFFVFPVSSSSSFTSNLAGAPVGVTAFFLSFLLLVLGKDDDDDFVDIVYSDVF